MIQEDQAQAVVDRFLTAQDTVDMVALVKGDELIKATDQVRRGSNPNFWRTKGPFALYLLKSVPLTMAEKLVDHGERRGFSFKSNRDAWLSAKIYAQPRPFQVQP